MESQTTNPKTGNDSRNTATGSARLLTAQVTAGFAVAMGIGRFVYTPILPIMTTALALPAVWTSWIAAANYLGYFIGALLLSRFPGWVSTALLRISLAMVVITLAVMPLTEELLWFCAIRLLSGLASAFVFVCLSNSAIDIDRRGGEPGLAYGGVGLGICLSGVLVLSLGAFSWDALWYFSAALAAVLTVPAFAIRLSSQASSPDSSSTESAEQPHKADALQRRALMVTYFLEGAGYIIIGTYLVAIVKQTAPSEIATSVWIVAGLAAIGSPALWRKLRSFTTARTALTAAYITQLGAAALPLFSSSTAAAFIAAALFGATFMGITQLSISEGHNLGITSAPARLTTVYSLGQILGPVLVAPLISDGYTNAFILATALLIGCVVGSLLLPANR